MAKRRKNPFEPGLSKYWYLRGRVAGKKRYADMYAAWKVAKAKPITPGGRVTAQESFYQGYMDVAEAKRNPLKIGKWIKAKIKKLRNGGYRVEVPGYGLPYGMRPKDR